ncbi:MAG: restriction endonuclease subunit S [Candidatus Celaenobacter polaris]|nr:restriction endonuclease subunit S [Candidatus Celaenobacter polaris]
MKNNSTFVLLSEISETQIGSVLSRNISKSESGFLAKILTLKSLSNNGAIDLNKIESIYFSKTIDKKYLSQKDDIVIRFSEPFTSCLITENETNLIIPSSLCRIRITSQDIMPSFLTWYLNSSFFNKQITKHIQTSTINIISMKMINNIEIPLIGMDTQKKITDIQNLVTRYINLTNELESYQQIMGEEIIKKFIHQE